MPPLKPAMRPNTRHVSYIPSASITLKINDTGDIGKVIGKGGANIRKLEADTGAKINVNTRGAVVSISGTEEAVTEAKFLVQRIIGGPNVRCIKDLSEQSIQILSSSQSVLQALEERYGVAIDVGRRDVFIEANDEDLHSLDQVVAELQDVLDQQLSSKTVTIPVDNPTVLSEVFKDALVTSLRDTYGIQIDTIKSDIGVGVSVKGPAAAVEEARQAIDDLLHTGARGAIIQLLPGMTGECDDRKWNDFLSDLHTFVEIPYSVTCSTMRLGNRIQVSNDGCSSIGEAMRMVQELLIYYFSDHCAIFYVRPVQAMTDICGREDSEIVRYSGRDCVLSTDKERGLIWICGTEKGVGVATSRFEASLVRWKSSNAIVIIPDSRAKGFIIGTGGERLRQIQMQTGASVRVEGRRFRGRHKSACADNYVHLTANSESELDHARSLVLQSIRAWEEQQANRNRFPPTPSSLGGRAAGFRQQPRGRQSRW